MREARAQGYRCHRVVSSTGRMPMYQRIRNKVTSTLLATLIALLVLPWAALADDISNNLDAVVDADAEVMPLNVGGAPGTTQLYVVERNGDGKQGCNLTGSKTL